MAETLPLLKVEKTGIVDSTGKPIILKGVALGGWLNMEGYMMCGRNIAEKAFKEGLEKALGRDAVADFTREFRRTFVREYDIKLIKSWGANCIRVPFNYRVVEFEDKPFSLNEEGLSYIDAVVSWCEKHGIYCILDMHAVPGAQNPDWHADCVGTPEFFSNDFNKDRYYRLWHFLAGRYKDSTAVAGYDVLNEPVVPFHQEGMIKEVYERVTKEIRDVDQNHIIFLEGNFWGQRVSFLGTPGDHNTAYSIHTYPPSEFTFNWEPDLVYPGKVYNITWSKKQFSFLADQYRGFVDRHEVPLYVGEFGVNWRGGHFGELAWVKDMLDVFEKNRFHWTYWTYKTVANATFPDGIFRYVKNPAWINRKGPVTGWENFYTYWKTDRSAIIRSWKTESFALNEQLVSALRNHW